MGSQHAKRLLFIEEYQKKFFRRLIDELNLSQRKLAKKLNVSRRTLRNWLNGTRSLPEPIFYKCVKILPELKHYMKFISHTYPANWGRIKGGKVRGKMKSNLTQELRMKGFRIANLRTVKRRVKGPNGEKMYNSAEKNLAEFLIKNGFDYEYEPAITLGNKYAFPDFLIGNTIIERCGYSDWSGYWNRVIGKLKLYEKYFKGKFIIIVPSNIFEVAVRRIMPTINNVVILKENELDTLPSFIKQGL